MRTTALSRARSLRFAIVLGFALLPVASVLYPRTVDSADAPVYEAGFEEAPPITGLNRPVAFAWAPAPDNRLFVAEKAGVLRVVKNGVALPTPAIVLPVNNKSERGLLGVAVDPKFPARPFVYLYYSGEARRVVNRISRFTITGDVAVDEKILVDGIPSQRGEHNAGHVQFGPDGMLYASTGDAGSAKFGHSQNLDSLGGKILRIDPDTGLGVPDNPFWSGGKRHTRDRVWAYGFRNPWRFSFQPGTGTIYVGDVGNETWEELSIVQRGANYGWPKVEGPHPAGKQNMVYPLFAYSRSGLPSDEYQYCSAIVAGDFVAGSNFPRTHAGEYFFADYDSRCQKIFRMHPDRPWEIRTFASGIGQPVHLAFGPDGWLYLGDYIGNQIRRIRYASGNRRPQVREASATPSDGAPPLQVTFTASASDPENDTVSYRWDFGDGASSAKANTTHTYTYAGSFQAVLTVTDSKGGVTTAGPFAIRPGNTAPITTITVPGDGTRLRQGDTITLRGTGSDAEDGPLAGANLKWEVRRWHGTSHFHPWAEGVGERLDVTMPEPEDLTTAGTSSLEVRLTATDKRGSATTRTLRLLPDTVQLTFQTQPSGLKVVLDGQLYSTPVTVTSAKGWSFAVDAPVQTDSSCRGYQLKPYRLRTPERDTTVTLDFKSTKVACTPTPTGTP